MRLGPALPRSFYARDCRVAARELVGATLVRRFSDGSCRSGRLVEVEAYLGDGSDAASHSHRGPTQRTRSMFGPPGSLYVYLSYGIHTCVNLVCEPKGRGAAVLIRAIQPLEGLAEMRSSRGLRSDQSDRLIASGPGRLTQALAIGLAEDGSSAVRGSITVHAGTKPPALVATGTRIGIRRATGLALRFGDASSPWLSRPFRD